MHMLKYVTIRENANIIPVLRPSFAGHCGVLALALVGFATWWRRHELQDRGTAGWLSLRFGWRTCIVWRRRLLLGLPVLAVGAQNLDLLPLPVARGRLGVRLQQVERLAVLLWTKGEIGEEKYGNGDLRDRYLSLIHI